MCDLLVNDFSPHQLGVEHCSYPQLKRGVGFCRPFQCRCGIVCDSAATYGLDWRYFISQHARHTEIYHPVLRVCRGPTASYQTAVSLSLGNTDCTLPETTCPTTFAQNNQHLAVQGAELVATKPENRKYVDLDPRKHIFTLLMNSVGVCVRTGDVHPFSVLMQRISAAIPLGSAARLRKCMDDPDICNS
ncbi:hypothetical protein GJ496_000581 [Pomphorhynchus laevis]|nr:hypothetical protein GJ496_000581 [Pomphorhynchus laevis]